MKKIFALALAFALALPAIANEGMWLPILLNRNYDEMQKMGLKLTPEEIYSVNNGSLKDAIVSFGGFCTGEIISPNGLILTNHHCGYSAIQTHSTVENDYLSDGFWARSYEEEKPNEGLFVRFLVRMEDVSERVNTELNNSMSEDERKEKIAEISKTIADEANEEGKYETNVKSFFHGNEFYLFVYEVYNDVRLVGAPPSSIGKYGGDTDNWMWPRHTGDFSMFRVYTAPDGSPAEYSEDNIPMKPKHHLPVSTSGIDNGDFTMVFGYPGSTDRFLSSYGVEQAINSYNPTVVKIRDQKLKIMKKYMNASDATRIQYASKYARVSNYWKYYIGQTEQLKNNKVYAKKKKIEDDFAQWVSAKPARQEKYGQTLQLLEEAYAATDNTVKAKVYVLEAGLIGPELPLFAFRMSRTLEAAAGLNAKMDEELEAAGTDEERAAIRAQYKEKREAMMTALKGNIDEHFKNYNVQLDEELMAELFAMYAKNVPADQQPAFFARVQKKYKGDWAKFADKVYDKSIFASKEETMEFLEDIEIDDLEDDWGVKIGTELYTMYKAGGESDAVAHDKQEKGYRLLTAGLREMDSDLNFAPDANSTMRMTYGTVGSYQPRDGVKYKYYTTAEGILEKMDNDDPEFVVPEKLETLIREKDFGPYTNEYGELPVCFIHNTDITGGNSGSPVINGRGELIGCAFDGNWEAMSGDIAFEDNLQRTISVDARYILFIVDKYAGATNLIEEMTLVSEEDAAPVTEEKEATTEEAMAQ